ncbi:hypothetical protein MJO29_001947, partial [Puccinia striiformis f. sp. tritici]
CHQPRYIQTAAGTGRAKTALVNHVTSRLRDDGTLAFHPLPINLQSVGSYEDAKQWSKQSKNLTNNTMISPQDLPLKPGELLSVTSAAHVVTKLGDILKPWNLYNGERPPPPALVIDEANNSKWMNDKPFLDIAVQITNQEGKMHVIFTSSDSFCDSWLGKHRYQSCPLFNACLG